MRLAFRLSLVALGLAAAVYGAAALTGSRVGSPDIDQTLALLRSAEPAVRYEAVVRLAMLPPTAARRDGLASAVRDSDADVRLMAAIAIVGDGPTEFTGPLRAPPATAVTPGAAPNPASSRTLSPAERLVYLDPRLAGTLLPQALVAVQSGDYRVRALGQRAIEQLRIDVPAIASPTASSREREDLLVLSLPDGESDAALAMLVDAKIMPTSVGGGMGFTGIYVLVRDFDAAHRLFSASPATAKYLCARDCPANGGPSVPAK